MRFQFIVPVLSALILNACALSAFNQLEDIPRQLTGKNAATLADQLSEKNFPKRDWVVVRLERASLLLSAGRAQDSFNEFSRATQLMDEFYTVRLTESNYAGNPLEQLSARSLQILAALSANKPDRAAVAARQTEALVTEYTNANKELPYACPTVAWYFASIAFAANRENGNANVAAQNAQRCQANSGAAIEKTLAVPQYTVDKKQVWIVLGEGFVGKKIERSDYIRSSLGPIKFVWSDYRESARPRLAGIELQYAQQRIPFQLLQDFEPSVKTLLEAGGALEKTKAVARTSAVLLSAQALLNSANRDDASAFLAPLAAVAVIVAANEKAQAEIRSWRSLPRRWWVARIELEPTVKTAQLQLNYLEGNSKTQVLQLSENSAAIRTEFVRETYLD